MVMFGIARMTETSSTAWCVLPAIPAIRPVYCVTILTGSRGWAMRTRIWSRLRFTTKTAKVTGNGMKPAAASPAAIPSMFCSAIPTGR